MNKIWQVLVLSMILVLSANIVFSQKSGNVRPEINCNEQPMENQSLQGLNVWKHVHGGLITFDSDNINLYLTKNQIRNKIVSGQTLYHDLYKKFEHKKILNANVLDYLVAHKKLIPNNWKGKQIFFWGTIYHRPGGWGIPEEGEYYVRYLEWFQYQGWQEGYRWFTHDQGWRKSAPAAILN